MEYISTRGQIAPITFSQAVMMGLASDGGLLLPATMEPATPEEVAAWEKLSYPELAARVISRFATDIPADVIADLVRRSYATFDHPEVAPLVSLEECLILELFHGPTLAFKDIALQFLGNLFEYLLAKNNDHCNILGATSGDTGSAAIYGVRGKKGINIFILHPHGRVSPIQELQMTTVTDPNVFNIAVKGTFDDAQAIVKGIMSDLGFKERYHLAAVNSINWARIVAQVVYYLSAALNLTGQGGMVDFAVPTGNFGDIFAGFVARKILPAKIRRLILATNENDLLARFVNQGDYSVGKVVPTISPSMDIQVASNFERYLYYLNGEDAEKTREQMEAFGRTGRLSFSAAERTRIQQDFAARSVSQEETLAIIRRFHQEHGYILDPHTAVGVKAALELSSGDTPVVCLATAHPAKFGEAVARAIGREVALPPALQDLASRPRRVEVMDADLEKVKEFVRKNGL